MNSIENSFERFDDRVENYVKYRPGYPEAVFDLLEKEFNLSVGNTVADLGTGTGISAKPFLERGFKVYGIEPNEAMRSAATRYLHGFEDFYAVEGTSQETGLATDSVELVTAFQAFHWFNDERAVREIKRIVKDGGGFALVWNERQLDSNAFLREYEAFLERFGNDYALVRHDNLDTAQFENSFGTPIKHTSFPNSQICDFEQLKGRMCSSSYMPNSDSANFEMLINALGELFAKHQTNNRVELIYDTNIYYGIL
ncbi:MAG: class I SAM-dependent methyltransferase [Pyrinomonadaceae bacterium]